MRSPPRFLEGREIQRVNELQNHDTTSSEQSPENPVSIKSPLHDIRESTPEPEEQMDHILKSMIFSNQHTLSPLSSDIETSSTDEEKRLKLINNASDATIKRSFTKKALKCKSSTEKEQKKVVEWNLSKMLLETE